MLEKWLSTTGGLLAAQLIACGSAGSNGSLPDAPNGTAASPTGQLGEAIVDGSTDSADRAVLAIALVTRQEDGRHPPSADLALERESRRERGEDGRGEVDVGVHGEQSMRVQQGRRQ